MTGMHSVSSGGMWLLFGLGFVAAGVLHWAVSRCEPRGWRVVNRRLVKANEDLVVQYNRLRDDVINAHVERERWHAAYLAVTGQHQVIAPQVMTDRTDTPGDVGPAASEPS